MRHLRLVAATALLSAVTACANDTDGTGSGTAQSSAQPTVSTSASTSASTSTRPTATVTVTQTQPSTRRPSPSTVAPPATPLRTVTVSQTISGKSYVIRVWAERKDPTCANHAYGTPVINYLTAHPCGGLHRLLATTTINGREVGFAESRLGFEGDTDAVFEVAADFRTLVTQEGTGNLEDLFREGYRLPSGPASVPSPNAFSAVGQDAGVVIDELWYLSGPTPMNDPPLVQFARDIFLQFA